MALWDFGQSGNLCGIDALYAWGGYMGNRCFGICAFFVVLQGCSGSVVEDIQSDWVLVGGSSNVEGMGEVKMFIDKHSLEKNGDVYSYKDKVIMSNDADGVKEIISSIETDCKQNTSRVKRADIYHSNGKVDYDTEYGAWEPVKNDTLSNGYAAYKFVCLDN